MRKRLLAAIAAAVMTASCLTACGENSSSDTTSSSKYESSSIAETTTTTEATTESKTETNTTTTAETTATTTTQETTTQAPKNQNRVVLDVKNIQAAPELPKGSEITCAAMVLNYYGINVDKMNLLKYLNISEKPDANGVWVTFWEAYAGDPKSDTGYGCYNPVMLKAVRNYFRAEKNSDYEVKDPVIVANRDFDKLYDNINNNTPVILWLSENMEDIIFDKKGWKTDLVDFHFPTNMRCYVLIGYDKDKNTLIFSDPLDAKGTVEYPKERVEKVYDQLGSQALVIRKK